MTEAVWRRRLGRVLVAASKAGGKPAALRDIAFGVYRLLETGDNHVQNAFERCSEADFGDPVALGARLVAGDYEPPAIDALTLQDAVALAGGLLRGLEKALLALGSRSRGRLRTHDLEVTFGGDRGWLLPFGPRFRGPVKDWPPYFAKRGLEWHRCLPRRLSSGHEVDLHLFDHGFPDEVVAAGGLFRSVDLLNADGEALRLEGPFVVGGLSRLDPEDLEGALARACDPEVQADILIFPELTIAPADRAEVIRLLQSAPWRDGLDGHRPALVVAGSWHDPIRTGARADVFANVAPVYGGLGQALGRHFKHAPYGIVGQGEPFRENVVSGDKILVLASRSMTLAVAICLDFCQQARANPYDDLDVDMVLVTSFAGARTTQMHQAQAERIWHRRKTATFLVQQSDDGPYGVSGASPGTAFSEAVEQPFVVRRFPRAT